MRVPSLPNNLPVTTPPKDSARVNSFIFQEIQLHLLFTGDEIKETIPPNHAFAF
jgi:hypothetical protein